MASLPNMMVYNVSNGVMLAKEYTGKEDIIGKYMSEKYDGERAIWTGRELRTRSNKIINAPEWFIKDFPKGISLDGELYAGRGKFQNTMSYVRKHNPIDEEWKKIKFMVFDVPHLKVSYIERYALLKQLKLPRHVKIVEQILIKNLNQVEKKFKEVIEGNGEGLMIRDPTKEYVGKRTKDLLKMKETQDAEAIIMNIIEGTGKYVGMMGALKVKTKNNIEFKVGSGFTNKNRKNMYNKNKYIGKQITFSHKGLTNAKKPRHPSFIRIRPF